MTALFDDRFGWSTIITADEPRTRTIWPPLFLPPSIRVGPRGANPGKIPVTSRTGTAAAGRPCPADHTVGRTRHTDTAPPLRDSAAGRRHSTFAGRCFAFLPANGNTRTKSLTLEGNEF